MKKTFKNRIEATDWIANYVENEAQFEVLREQLNYNFIYTNELYLEIDEESPIAEIVWLGDSK